MGDINAHGYLINSPIVKRSRLTKKENGGIGKDLSEGWAANYSIGCSHACTFCYVDSIHRRYRGKRFGFEDVPWGKYLLIPQNLDDAIEQTTWSTWSGKEVMLSSTHDPYLPQLAKHTRHILELALPQGVRFCIQTRAPLVRRDLGLLEEHSDQVRIQVSIATMDRRFARAIEPRVAPPEARLTIIKEAKAHDLSTGIIIAPVFPSIKLRPDPSRDVDLLMSRLADLRPDHIYGECLHARGSNLAWTEQAIGERIAASDLKVFDRTFQRMFRRLLMKHGLKGEWWPDHRT
jgi:DNA repair photolyase